jgi:hypothetical protein
MTDGRWDMKFLGMQIMVEGLALGAFGTMYKRDQGAAAARAAAQRDPRRGPPRALRRVALREHFRKQLTEAERREREDWAFEVALLMRNRFMAYEVYEEWFEGA